MELAIFGETKFKDARQYHLTDEVVRRVNDYKYELLDEEVFEEVIIEFHQFAKCLPFVVGDSDYCDMFASKVITELKDVKSKDIIWVNPYDSYDIAKNQIESICDTVTCKVMLKNGKFFLSAVKVKGNLLEYGLMYTKLLTELNKGVTEELTSYNNTNCSGYICSILEFATKSSLNFVINRNTNTNGKLQCYAIDNDIELCVTSNDLITFVEKHLLYDKESLNKLHQIAEFNSNFEYGTYRLSCGYDVDIENKAKLKEVLEWFTKKNEVIQFNKI